MNVKMKCVSTTADMALLRELFGDPAPEPCYYSLTTLAKSEKVLQSFFALSKEVIESQTIRSTMAEVKRNKSKSSLEQLKDKILVCFIFSGFISIGY